VSTLAIEISDAGIVVGSESRGRVDGPASPGFALIDGSTLVTGAEARAQARLKPRRVSNRFWSELDTSPLGKPFHESLSRADLAHAQLKSVWDAAGAEAGTVVLALPGTFTEEQLGLTLGIARACGMPVHGMVDAAVASAVEGVPAGNLLHVDLQLHRAVVTELIRGNEIVRRQVRVGERIGLVALHDRLVKRIADLFVRSTRFDPLHAAVTEQALYDRLPLLFEELHDDEAAVVEIVDGSVAHAVELRRGPLIEAVEAQYQGIVDLVRMLKRSGEQVTLLLSSRVRELPGLEQRISGIGGTGVQLLAPEAAVAGALQAVGSIRSDDEALPFVTRLPAGDGASSDRPVLKAPAIPVPSRRAGGPTPTHLLFEDRAYPITTDPLIIGLAPPVDRRGLRLTGATSGVSRSHCDVVLVEQRVVVEDHSTHGSFVNGERVDGRTELIAGDRLRVGTPGIELRMIRTVEPDGTAHG
jgi:hypothetical protein